MSKSYKERRQQFDYDPLERHAKHQKRLPKFKQKKEKSFHNALRSVNLPELIKYSEDD